MVGGGSNSPDPGPDLGFSFHLVGGTGKLALREQRFFDWVVVDRLELEVPDLPLPVDLADGPSMFQRRRTRVTLATLRMHQADIDRFVARARDALAAIGVDDLHVRATDGYLAVTGRARDDRNVAEFSARVYVRGRGAKLRLVAAEPHVFGFLTTPGPMLVHHVLTSLLGGAAEVRGVGDVEVAPLAAFLWNALPPHGWRLPNANGIDIIAARSTRGAIEVSYAARSNGAAQTSPARGASDLQLPEAAAYLDAARRFRDGDEYLLRRDLDSALRAYRNDLEGDPEQPHLVARILGIAASQPSWFRDGVDLAVDALSRWPDFPAACCARAAIAIAEGDPRDAADWFAKMADLCARAGDDEATARAALAGARLLRPVEPIKATALYERVLIHRPGHGESADALAERYEDEERWHDLVRLIRTRIAATSDRSRQARDHVRLALILRDALDDAVRARDELELATQLAPDHVPAWEALADTLFGVGEHTLGIRALDTAASLYHDRGDARGEARAHVRVAQAWQDSGDIERASNRFARALELAPEFAPAIEGAARAATAAGRHDDASALWQRRIDLGGVDAATRAGLLYELGRSRVCAGDDAGARDPLAEAAQSQAGRASADAWAALAELEESAGRTDEAADAYAMAVAELGGADEDVSTMSPDARARAATFALARARLLDSSDDYVLAHSLDPVSDAGRIAARKLYEAAVAAGDTDTIKVWLDALVTEGMPIADEIEARLARAELALQSSDPDSAAIDLQRVLGPKLSDELDANQRARALWIDAALAGAAEDALGRARALTHRAEIIAKQPGPEAIDALVDAAEAWLAADDPEEALASARRAAVYAGDAGAEPERIARVWSVLGAASWRRRAWADVARAYRALLDGELEAGLERATCLYRLGIALDKQGDLDAAADALAKVTEEPQASGEPLATSWRVLAGVRERQGDHVAAARTLEAFAIDDRADANDATRADAWYRAGELFRKQAGDEHRADAERCLEAALRTVSDHLPALDALERIKRDEQDWERVAVILGRKIAATPHQADRQKALLSRLAALQAERLDRRDVALETYRRALEVDPHFRPALRFVADDAARRGADDEALSAYERLARALPGDSELDDDEEVEAERVEAALRLSALLVGRGRSAEAIEPLSLLSSRHPEDDRLLDALASAHRASGDWVEAAELLGKRAALVDDPTAALQCDLQRIAIYASHLDDRGAAWAACRAALSRTSDDPALLATAIGLSRSEAEPEDRVEVLVSAATSAKACDAAEVRAADLLVEAADLCSAALAQPERATELYRRALELEPNHPAALSGLGDTGLHRAVPEAIDDRATSGAVDAARELLEQGDADGALALLESADAEVAPPSLLHLRAELYETAERWEQLAGDLEALRERAADQGDLATEHQVTRRLAALTLERLHDHRAAIALYRRSLELDADDMAAAEALAGIFGRRRDRAEQIRALETVLAIARRTIAGPRREASVLRELARLAEAEGRPDRAAELLDEARMVAPYDLHSLRARAELAVTHGDYEVCAECLEALATRLGAGGDPDAGHTSSTGEILIELAHVYTDMLGDTARGREAMRRAARAFGKTARGDAALRMLASQALGDQYDEEVVAALEAIDPQRRTQPDLLNLAKALKRLGRDKRAIALLETARDRQPLPDEAAMLLFALHRELQRKAQLAASLERGAYEQPPEVARTRLREALIIYEQSLEDEVNAERLRGRLNDYAPTFSPVDLAAAGGPPEARVTAPQAATTPDELEEAADQAVAAGESSVACDLLAEAISLRARDLDAAGDSLDTASRAAIRRLREIARAHGHYEALARGLLIASAVERDRSKSLDMLREIAAVRLAHLHDPRGAADALARALALAPDDADLVQELDAALREIGDFPQLAAAYEMHLGAVEGVERAPALRALASIWNEVFSDPERADLYLSEARELTGQSPGDDDGGAGAAELDIENALRLAREFAERGQMVAAISQYEAASAADPYDQRPLEALAEIYRQRSDTDALTEVLGRQIVAAATGRERGRLWYERAKLYRDVLHREPETYRCLKEAYANDPNNRDIAYALRSVAMARGEWALAAELLYREIDAAPSTPEAAALHLELALIYDEKLFDAGQARVNYEQALELDPEIPAAPAPLARLYELSGRHLDAARMGEVAARHAADDEIRSRLLRRAAACAERAGQKDDARRLFGLSAMFAADAADSNAAHASVARLSTDPGDRLVHLEVLEMRLSETEDPEEQQDLRHQLLDIAVAAGETAAIRRHAGELLERDAGDLSAFLALKRAATAVGDWSILAYLLRTRAGAVDDRVERAALFYELGRLSLDRLQDTGGAIAAFEQALSADPRHPAALEALADIAYHKTDWARARDLYARLRPESCSLPADVLAYRRGEVCEAMGDLDEAAAAYAEACRVCPSNRMALAALARTALQLGDLAAAVDASRAMVEFMPPDDLPGIAAARIQVAELARRAEMPDTAIEYYERVLADQPKRLSALQPLADLYREQERFEDLARTLRTLAGLAGSPAERAAVEYQRGEVLHRLGDDEEAANAYLRAIDLDPNSAPTQRRLVDYYVSIDDLSTAMEMVQELQRSGALLSPETGKSTLARALLIAGQAGDIGLALQIGERLADPAPLAAAMVEAAERDAGLIPGLVETARAIGRAHSVIRLDALAGSLGQLEGEVAQKLAKAVGAG